MEDPSQIRKILPIQNVSLFKDRAMHLKNPREGLDAYHVP